MSLSDMYKHYIDRTYFLTGYDEFLTLDPNHSANRKPGGRRWVEDVVCFFLVENQDHQSESEDGGE